MNQNKNNNNKNQQNTPKTEKTNKMIKSNHSTPTSFFNKILTEPPKNKHKKLINQIWEQNTLHTINEKQSNLSPKNESQASEQIHEYNNKNSVNYQNYNNHNNHNENSTESLKLFPNTPMPHNEINKYHQQEYNQKEINNNMTNKRLSILNETANLSNMQLSKYEQT